MIAFFILALLILVVIGWLKLRDQIQAVDSRVRWSAKEERAVLEREIATLAGRVRVLEEQLKEAPVTVIQPVLQPAPASAQAAAPRSAISIEPPPAPLRDPRPAVIAAARESKAAPLQPGWSDRLRRLLANKDWEQLVAGSLLNKLGALIFVIGIALFLGYSLTLVHPAARAASAALISAAILIGGVILERRQNYRVFSRGLIGAGWAALYTTAYAMYALPGARVISDPFAGSILLLVVGTGMIAHSLLYRAQAVTAVAYFSAFAALAATPSTPFAVASLVPLSASLLYFAWRFEWHTMALFGLFATYATCIPR